jgi:pseudouridine synthase
VPLVSLPRLLAIQQFACRKIAVEYIRNARVMVNNVISQDPNTRVNYKRDAVKVDAMDLQRNRPSTYLLIHKPAKVSGSREAHTFTVHSMIHDTEAWYFPLGRLIKAASGLTLLTNDPAHRGQEATAFHYVEKEYRIKVQRQVKKTELTAMTKALRELNADNASVAKVEVVRKNSRHCWIGFTLYHGSFADLFTILKQHKLEPLSMQRYRIGELNVDMMTPGSWKQLNNVEINQMFGTETENASFFFK